LAEAPLGQKRRKTGISSNMHQREDPENRKKRRTQSIFTHGIDWSRKVLFMKTPTAYALDFGLCAITRNQKECKHRQGL
jgi:hypothetical protein